MAESSWHMEGDFGRYVLAHRDTPSPVFEKLPAGELSGTEFGYTPGFYFWWRLAKESEEETG